MKSKLRYTTFLWLFLLGLALWLAPMSRGQASITLTELLVELWPEYDRPEVLVIYRGELSPGTSLPAQLSFSLPSYIEAMHAVAAEQNGNLLEIDPATITLRRETDSSLLTFTVSSPRFQFEYYDPLILTLEGQNRSLDFEFSTLYPIEMTTFEVQEPVAAGNFSMTPQAEDSFTGADGLRYNTISRANLGIDSKFELAVTYQRQTNELSAPSFTNIAPPTDTGLEVQPATVPDLNLGYLLIGLGGILLLVAVGFWWWSRQAAVQPRRGSRRASRSASRSKRPAPDKHNLKPKLTPANEIKFCYRCGIELRSDAKFCHNCGAERRQ